MDGYQFIQAVRNLPDHKGKHTPALALTAGFNPISRTVWLSLNYITDAFRSVCVFLVIESLDVIEDICPCFSTGSILSAIYSLALEHSKEAFCRPFLPDLGQLSFKRS